MAISRADTITGNIKKVEEFSDFLDTFAVSPFGKQLGRVVNEKAVNQSLKNLIMTNLGERPFQPYIGSQINTLLFQNNSMGLLEDIRYHIQQCVENNEPRVNILEIQVFDGNDPNEIQINIIYNLINNPTAIVLDFLLKRVR